MFLPQINEYGTKNFAVQSFGGLDTRPKAAFASMKQMLNLSSDAYPAVIPSENRRQAVVMTGISAIEGQGFLLLRNKNKRQSEDRRAKVYRRL